MPRKKHGLNIKRGRLSKDERATIEQLCLTKTDEELAHKLSRAVASVRQYRLQYLTHNPQLTIKQNANQEIIDALHNHPDWEFIVKEFTKDELILFENSYASLLKQFNCDIFETERKQINNAITIEIYIHRHNQERMLSQKDIDRLDFLINREMAKPESEQDIKILSELESQLQASRAASGSRTKELKDLLEKHGAILKDLKGTREQRIAKIESSKETFIGLLRKLEDQDNRRSIGIEMNLMSAAVEKEKEKMFAYHTYADGGVDRPMLNAESIKLEEESK